MNSADFARLLSHVFLPRACPLCGAPGYWVCEKCLERALAGPTPTPRCLRCGAPAPCSDHGARYELRPLVRHEGEARSLLLAAKYGGAGRLALRLGQAMRRLAPPGEWTVTVIPPHKRRGPLPTGGTHLDWMARGLSASGVKRRDLLRWRRSVTPQKERRSAAERRALPADCFACVAPAPGRVLVIDDVCTTGTTLLRAATRLYESGAREVLCLCFGVA